MIVCELCGTELQIGDFPFCKGDATKHVQAVGAVIGDDIPGGLVVNHLDSTPRRFYSRTEIKRAANEKGLVWDGDTPGKPYNVKWSGRREKENR